MRIVSIDELEIHDKVVVQKAYSEEVEVLTVLEVWPDDLLIVFKEKYPLDYAPEDPDQIVVLDLD